MQPFPAVLEKSKALDTTSEGSTPRTRSSDSWRTWLLLPIAVFLLARVMSSVILVLLGDGHAGMPDGVVPQIQTPTTSLNLHSNWDAQWYKLIVEEGYPSELPRNASGEVLQNQWAFFPTFPGLTSGLVNLGLPFDVAGIIISLMFGSLAMVLLFGMLAGACGRFTALLTVTSLSFSPASLAFGVPYAESLALALVLLCLVFLGRNKPVAFLISALALSLTRPIAPAMAAVVGVVWLVRWFNRRREPFPRREQWIWAGVACATASFFLLWPLYVGGATGEWNAYALTQQAWVLNTGGWGTWLSAALSGDTKLVLVGLVLVGALALALRYARRWPVAMRAWTVLYPLFIFGASRPTPSIFRYLMLTAAPAWPMPDLSRRIQAPWARITLLAVVATAGLGLQVLWIKFTWLSSVGFFP